MECIMQYKNFRDRKSGKHMKVVIVWLLIALPCNGFLVAEISEMHRTIKANALIWWKGKFVSDAEREKKK